MAGGDDDENKKLELHSPVGTEQFTYTWPLIIGTGTDQHDGGADIIDTVRWVCEELPEIKSALEDIVFHEVDTTDYHAMKYFCDRYNKVIDSFVALVRNLVSAFSYASLTLVLSLVYSKKEHHCPPFVTHTQVVDFYDTLSNKRTMLLWPNPKNLINMNHSHRKSTVRPHTISFVR